MSSHKSNKTINIETNCHLNQRKNMSISKKQEKLNINTTAVNNCRGTDKQRQEATYLAIGLSLVVAMAILPEIAFASKFDINAGVAAATTPLIKAIDDHWGKAVLLTGCVGALIGEGDARQRVVRAAITATGAGGVVLALLAMLT